MHSAGIGTGVSVLITVMYNSQVRAFTGPAQLLDALTGCDLVVIPAGVPRKPGMTVRAGALTHLYAVR